MKNKINKKGFSLAEILMSLGILSIGMLLIAAVFPVGIHFTTIATERTIASSVADEAFAKIRMYCSDLNFSPIAVGDVLEAFPPLLSGFPAFNEDFECSYPSDDAVDVNRRMYSWSALWRRLNSDPTGRSVQITVFVSRRGGASARYYKSDLSEDGLWPIPLPVTVRGANSNQITVNEGSNPQKNFINPGCTIVDDTNGRIYRVLDRNLNNVVFLDGIWRGDTANDSEVWVVAPPVGGGRYPCIAVYQKVIRF